MEAHTDAVWVNLYVRRWLAAPLVMPDGSLLERERGTPQGAPVSPVLANLFLHNAFDTWMTREFPSVWSPALSGTVSTNAASTYRMLRTITSRSTSGIIGRLPLARSVISSETTPATR